MNDIRGLAPTGWHIPSNTEWTTLSNYLGGELVAGGKMKAVSDLWVSNTGTNSSGFTGLPGGYKAYNGSLDLRYRGYFWNSTEKDVNNAFTQTLLYDGQNLGFGFTGKWDGESIRCVKD